MIMDPLVVEGPNGEKRKTALNHEARVPPFKTRAKTRSSKEQAMLGRWRFAVN
jgi:hypothetical protein